MSWIADLRRVLDEQPCVLVTLNLISGSAPRESGSRMIVTAAEITGSIGGGNLEFQAMEKARDLLENRKDRYQEQVLYGLGPALNQCCGGAVSLLYEVFNGSPPSWLEELQASHASGLPVMLVSATDAALSHKVVLATAGSARPSLPAEVSEAAHALMHRPEKEQAAPIEEISVSGKTWWLEYITEIRKPVMLFGAGHVGQAVARALAPLPFDITWADSRAGVFPVEVTENIHILRTADPPQLVAGAVPGSLYIVMTHSHQLDEDICFEVLSRGDFSWLGLIGSATKRRRFAHRLEQRGIESSKLDALVCPIGLSSIRGKQPATIALSLAAQLMAKHE